MWGTHATSIRRAPIRWQAKFFRLAAAKRLAINVTGDGDPPSGSGDDPNGFTRRRQPFSSLAAVAWAQTQVDPTVPEHKRLIARDQLIEACRRENVWAATFLAGMLAESCAGIPAHDPAWFLTGRVDVMIDDNRDRYLSRLPDDPMSVPRREGAVFDEQGWLVARATAPHRDWPERPGDPDTSRWGRLVPAGDQEWGAGQLRQLAGDLLYDEPPGDRAMALVSFALRSASATQFVLRSIGDEAWQRAGEQGLQFPARDGAAARAMTTAALEAIGWSRRRSSLHAERMHADEPSSAAGEFAVRKFFLGAAELAAQFASPGHYASVRGAGGSPDEAGSGVPAEVAWMNPALLAAGPAWDECLVAGMRALVLTGPGLAA